MNKKGYNKALADATLVTATTAMTMETPFTLDTPLAATPTLNAMDTFDQDYQSKRLGATSVALPIKSKEESGGNNTAIVSFYIVLIHETKKCLTDFLVIIVAWVRHFSTGRYRRRRTKGGMEVGLLLPSLNDSDVIQEYRMQSRPLGFYHLPSFSSNEPGMSVEIFVPDVPTATANGRVSVDDVYLPKKRSFWLRLFSKKSVEIPTTRWEAEQSWSDNCDQYEEFGIWDD